VAKLSAVFRGCPAWGELIVPGESPGTYRFAEAGGASDEPPVTRGGEEPGGEWIDDE